MRNRQSGISLLGLIFGGVVLIFAALLGMKVTPSYIEYFNAKKAIHGIVNEGREASVADLRKSFDARATIDDITSIRGADIEVSKEGGLVVLSFAYRREIRLFSNVALCIDFAASTSGQ
ncbi:MAG: hypothetical protein AMJ64_07815 [Betaproteobacteria bacterium SG8_39]|nr:MAG: hypothetical protein AMJ64_07815 [Betaproteobacteria bacterium SG8_39]